MRTFSDKELREIRRADKEELAGSLTREDFEYEKILEREWQKLRRSTGGLFREQSKRQYRNKRAYQNRHGEIISLYRQGCKPKEIARRLGLNAEYCRQIIRKWRKEGESKDGD